MLDTTTGEAVKKTLKHEGNAVREFYSNLPRPVRVGMEATGSMQWFVNLWLAKYYSQKIPQLRVSRPVPILPCNIVTSPTHLADVLPSPSLECSDFKGVQSDPSFGEAQRSLCRSPSRSAQRLLAYAVRGMWRWSAPSARIRSLITPKRISPRVANATTCSSTALGTIRCQPAGAS